MKILYDTVTKEYLYPLSKKDIVELKKYIPSEIIEKIKCIRFGCNTKTTQEGRTVKRGRFYDIRINFCLKNLQSLMLSDRKDYIEEIKEFCGKVDIETRMITWSLPYAKRYASYIFLHEIGHITYCEKYFEGQLNKKNSTKEELWCNNYSKQLIRKISGGTLT